MWHQGRASGVQFGEGVGAEAVGIRGVAALLERSDRAAYGFLNGMRQASGR